MNMNIFNRLLGKKSTSKTDHQTSAVNKYGVPVNNSYCATVVRIKDKFPITGLDNLVGVSFFGNTTLVSKDTPDGQLGIVFGPETQLSHDFCRMNNLYRHPEENKDPTQKGYIEANRRIRAQKFKGIVSSGLFMPMESLNYLGIDVSDIEEGMSFDKIAGEEICRKYFVPVKVQGPRNGVATPKSRIDKLHFPEHESTEQWLKCDRNVPDDEIIDVTAKIHGTSIRLGNTLVKVKDSIIGRIAEKLGVKVKSHVYEYVAGSRRVNKDPHNPLSQNYYKSDIHSEYLSNIEGKLPKGTIVFGELVGWTKEGSEIQKDYSYLYPKGMHELFVYRVATINEDGFLVDLSWDHAKEFCNARGLKTVPDLWKGKKSELDYKKFMDVRFKDIGYDQCLPLEKGLVDEGIVIRTSGLVPQFYKVKCDLFKAHESKVMDDGVADIESIESTTDEKN